MGNTGPESGQHHGVEKDVSAPDAKRSWNDDGNNISEGEGGRKHSKVLHPPVFEEKLVAFQRYVNEKRLEKEYKLGFISNENHTPQNILISLWRTQSMRKA